ncbi:UNVERIFIED_CONTAM: hypothetical protein Slati_3099300 [Sesamum latifolium]|uniref:Uncharacterized protein n=1 Tax=Sesamum latifolium TaxID=2727402 RepID=A0AAW2UVH7_9LAMI
MEELASVLLAFNQAMLTIQLRHILYNPASLAARVLKARYFPNTSILEAKIGYRPSYAWSSIFSTIPLILTGFRWRIDSGTSVRIWLDP